jgi:hydrogenase nickel incorporation protein HypA/HybF
MHELSVCNALLEQVERVARQHGASRVSSIVLRIGPLSGVEPDLLRRAYPLASAGTVAEDANLVIEHSDVVVLCGECGAESIVRPNRLLCEHCGDYRTRMISGDELILQRVELDNVATNSKPSAASDLPPLCRTENRR